MKFPHDGPIQSVIKYLESMGFHGVRSGNHISMERQNPDGPKTPLTMPNHNEIKGSTLRMICTQARITREDFIQAYENSG